MSKNKTSTHQFKSSNRQKPPSWSNRFRKDVNDLMYHPKDPSEIKYIKKSLKNHQSEVFSQSSKQSPIRKAIEKFDFKQSNSNQLAQKGLRRSQSTRVPKDFRSFRSVKFLDSQSNRVNNPQFYGFRNKILKNESILKSTDQMVKTSEMTRNFSSKTNSQGKFDKKYGLCQFEFSTKTIEGKIHSKYGHSLNLSKSRTNKINNVHPVYYNTEHDISTQEHEKRRMIQTLKKFRNFKNYQPHHFVSYRPNETETAEKFYQTSGKVLDLVKKKCSLQIDFGKNTPRSGLAKKLGTNLEYENVYTEIANSNSHRPLFDIQRTERKFTIPRQVITDSRGCYR